MIMPRRFAAVLVATFLIMVPALGHAEAVIGTKLLSAPSPAFTQRPAKVTKVQTVAFNWFANGATAASANSAKSVRQQSRVIAGKGTWICSPAGFGRRSRCYAG